jgi:hypothetical protein
LGRFQAHRREANLNLIGAVLLAAEIPAVLLDPFEWIEDGKPYLGVPRAGFSAEPSRQGDGAAGMTVPEPNYSPRPSEVSRRMSTLLGRGGA